MDGLVGFGSYLVNCQIPYLQGIRANTVQRLVDLNSGKIAQFIKVKHNYRTNRDEQIIVKKGDKGFDQILKGEITGTEQQIKYIDQDIKVMQKRITDWKPGKLRTNEA